jgi:Binding-protein-dependent transport system inner membrane component
MREPTVDVFFSRLPNTLAIIPWAIVFAVAVGIPLGVVAALNRGNIVDRAAGALAVLGIATPSFWLGVVLIFVFSVELGWLPSGRMGGPEHYVLPVITLGSFLIAGFMRLVRSSMLDVMGSEFVKRGLAQQVVAAQQHLTGDSACRSLGQQSHDGQRGQALAGTGFADQPQHLATTQREADAIDRLQHAATQEEMRVKIANLENDLAVHS